MGIRMDQFIGLNERGQRFAQKLRSIPGVKVWVWREIEGAWSPSVGPLHAYEVPEQGSLFPQEYPALAPGVYKEYVQAEPWSSGPCYFLAIMGPDGPIQETLWTDEEIDEFL